MLHPVFDFSDASLSERERFSALAALSRGFMPALTMFLDRIKAYTQLLEEELEGRPAAAQFLNAVQETVSSAHAWVATYQSATVLENEMEKVDLRPLLEGAIVRSSRILPAPMTLRVDLGEGRSVVQGVLFQLQEVFMRCIQIQGERLTDQGASVVVRMHEVDIDPKTRTLVKTVCLPGQYVAVTVAAGEEHFDLAGQLGFWEAFGERRDASPEHELPLVLVYGVVLEHGGDILWQAAAERPIMTILIPAERKRNEMQVSPGIEDKSLYGNETILLVDDEDMIWDVIIEMLQELGYSVILAENGKQAVEIYAANPGEIDLVMLDMVMPEMDGHQAFFRLKELDPDVCVLLSSGYVSQEDARDVLDAGAAGFLQKPYRMLDLARAIRGIFDRNPRNTNAEQ